MMRTLTIRGIDEELSKSIREAAQRRSMSINEFVLDLLRQSLGHKKEKKYTRVYHDLDHLFGRWDEEDARAVSQAIAEQRNGR